MQKQFSTTRIIAPNLDEVLVTRAIPAHINILLGY